MTKTGLALVALAMLPSLVAAQTDSSRMRVDTTRARHERTSAGAIGRATTHNHGLTADQTKQLQTALSQANCNPGTADGIWGPRTQRAMNCARQKNNITGNNPNDVFRSLNLSFTTTDSLGSRAGGRGMNRVRGDTSMRHSMRDSLRRPPTTRKDTTPKT
ncbi:MAG TPA: hypothetical protein VGH98_11030 [Gemmatimonadaceae bacterium]|jgi:peptidoglycan hydrolase-like protein with peptidoglycan-binding domain